MIINRQIENSIKSCLNKKKVIVIHGARQTGKTTLLKLLWGNNPDVFWINGDDPDINKIFKNLTADSLKALIGKKNILIIDEAQRIENIGLKLKIIYDQIPELKIIVTGSSSIFLANKINEPLTGRKIEFMLFPFSFSELADYNGIISEKRLLYHRLIYGYYPEVVNNLGDEKLILKNLIDSYLFKDVFLLEGILRRDKLIYLLQAIALQIGHQVSYNELANLCGLDVKTVEKYISLLEQTYIIFRLPSFSKNLRNELKFSRKIYFFDNGIRNAILNNFTSIELRSDAGSLWENFIVSEKIKQAHYKQTFANFYFWRTKTQQEIDLIEQIDDKLYAYEIKWKNHKKIKLYKSFAEAYPDSEFNVITPENFEQFIYKP